MSASAPAPRLEVADEAAMLALGARLGARLAGGMVVYLQGGLGMGKTTLARGLIQSLGHRGAVKSPTYTLVEPYRLPGLSLYHFDLFRLVEPQELAFIGIRDYFAPGALALVEWPERGAGFLPLADLTVRIAPAGPGRRVELAAGSPQGARCLGCLN